MVNNACNEMDIKLDDNSEMFPAAEIANFTKGLSKRFNFRPLRLGDYNKGYLDVLSELTVVGDISKEVFHNRFKSMIETDPHSYFIIVAEDKESQRIVGSISLVLEWKFIHTAGVRGRIEDLVVQQAYRSMGLARHLNEIGIQLAKEKGVYKLSLECTDKLTSFYEKFGYKQNQNFLVQRFD